MPDRKAQKRAGQGGRSQFQPQEARTSNQRRIDDREIVERFLIVCEGEKTEPNYFQEFRVPGRIVVIEGTGRNTLTLVDEAIRLNSEAKTVYDQVWCVFDRDSFRADDFNNAIQKARAAGIRAAYTNEAFELWYLLHFDDHRSALNRNQYYPLLQDRLGHEYRKNSASLYHELQHRQGQAIRRAESLLAEYGAEHNPQQDNPCTTVHLLVKALRANVTPRPNEAG